MFRHNTITIRSLLIALVASSSLLTGYLMFLQSGAFAQSTIDSLDVPTLDQFSLSYTQPRSGQVNSMAWGDMDMDGDLDLALGNDGINQLYRNEGDGTFSLQELSTETWQTAHLSWGDLEGDGDLDLAVANRDATAQIYVNDGTGQFETISLGEDSFGIQKFAWADLNGDGYLDLVDRYQDNNAHALEIFWNQGDGTLVQSDSIYHDYFLLDFVVGELDGDGDVDIAICIYSGGCRRLLNDGSGQFAMSDWHYATESLSLHAGDVDGDRDLDILQVRHYEPHNILFNDASASFVESESDVNFPTEFRGKPALGDMDNDGDLDIVIPYASQSSYIYRNDGGRRFTLFRFGPERDEDRLASWADIDNDQDLDVVVVNNLYGLDFYRNDLKNFVVRDTDKTGTQTTSVSIADYNSDGFPDIAIGNYGSPNRIYQNVGDGYFNFGLSAESQQSQNTTTVEWGDMDDDGDLDLAIANQGQPNQVYRNDGNNSFIPIELGPNRFDTSSINWGDMDGDGDLDLVVGNRDGPYDPNCDCWPARTNFVYRNDGGGTFTPFTLPTERKTASVVWGDMDGDGDLDIGVGNYGINQIYRNDGDEQFVDLDLGSESYQTSSVDWADMDGDGDLDLAVGNYQQPNQVYRNDGAGSFTSIPLETANSTTVSVQWTDVDGDADMDLVVGNMDSNQLYLNQGNGFLTPQPLQPEIANTSDIGASDLNGDGRIDFIIGTLDITNYIVQNTNGTFENRSHLGAELRAIEGIAWGDLDGDGDLDLATGGLGHRTNYVNNGDGSFHLVNLDADYLGTKSVAWGDMDGDYDLDLAIGNSGFEDAGEVNHIYVNMGDLNFTRVEIGPEGRCTTSVAWGDLDRDGDLDLAVGNGRVETSNVCAAEYRNQLYFNQGNGTFTPTDIEGEGHNTQSIALGDIDSDGDLDVAVANRGTPNQIFINNGVGEFAPQKLEAAGRNSQSIDLGDIDGDGDLDMVVGTETSILAFRNESLMFFRTIQIGLVPQTEIEFTLIELDGATLSGEQVALDDMDGDGDLDIATTYQLFINDGKGIFTVQQLDTVNEQRTDVAWGDMDNDGDLDIAVSALDHSRIYENTRLGTQLAPDHQFVVDIGQIGKTPASGEPGIIELVQDPLLPIPYTLYHPDGVPVGSIGVYYSLDDRAEWRVAYEADGTQMTNLATQDENLMPAQHVFIWNTLHSGFFGQSDSVRIRIEVYRQPNISDNAGTYVYANQAFAPIARQLAFAISYPFRAVGTSVRVQDQAGNGVSDAQVYRLPLDQDRLAQPIGKSEAIFKTDKEGLLAGAGAMFIYDRLIALAPTDAYGRPGEKYQVYQTSPIMNANTLIAPEITEPGVQTLTVSDGNLLTLFDLDLSLEWDARLDSLYLDQLEFDIRRASELLYDWSNGQVALGTVTVHHNKALWNQADIRVHATNRLRPHATIGGVVSSGRLTEVTVDGTTQPILYVPGHVEMGATWNRYGEAGDNLSEDWARTLAHELGHYLFFLFDNYIGLEDNRIVRVEGCPGVMSDPYSEVNSEFHPLIQWLPNCEKTLSHQMVGRSDWETMVDAYPWLVAPSEAIDHPDHAGPHAMPVAVTHVHFTNDGSPAKNFTVPTFFLLNPEGGPYIAGSGSRAFLFQDDTLIDLGAPRRDRIQAWNARYGAQLCVYELNAAPSPIAGCTNVVSGGTEMQLQALSNWQPDVTLTPVTASQLDIAVRGIPSGSALHARVYAADAQSNQAAQPAIPLTDHGDGTYSSTISLSQLTQNAYIHIYDRNSLQRSVVVDYALGGAPVLSLRNGDVLSLSNGSVLSLSNGNVINLSDGDVLSLSNGNVLIRYNDGSVLSLSNGNVLSLSNGSVLSLSNGNVISLSDGDVLSLSNGNVLLLQANGNVISLNHGDVLSLSNGNGVVLADGFAAIWTLSGQVLSLSNGNVLSLSNGSVLSLSNGNVLSLSNGNVLSLSNGNVQIVGVGEVLSLSNGNAPVRSSDGQVTLYVDHRNFSPDEFYTVQPTTIVPNAPSWTTQVGQAYRVTSSSAAPDLTQASISLNYLGRHIDDDKEGLLHIYFYAEDSPTGAWRELTTSVDPHHNRAVADAVGAGIYALMYSIDIPLYATGWNLISYPLAVTSPVPQAFASVAGVYSTVYGYDASVIDPHQRWEVYDVSAPAWVNDLTELKPGRGYWIHVTDETILKLPDVSAASVTSNQEQKKVFPAVYYGMLQTSLEAPLTQGMIVEAWIGNTLCGQDVVQSIDGQFAYRVIVAGEGPDHFAGCGTPNAPIRFKVGDYLVESAAFWNNEQTNEEPLAIGESSTVGELNELYLPVINH
ncbi:MAG: FG-GAP-like repeat-containing protein [Chloroflexota bacterium]